MLADTKPRSPDTSHDLSPDRLEPGEWALLGLLAAGTVLTVVLVTRVLVAVWI